MRKVLIDFMKKATILYIDIKSETIMNHSGVLFCKCNNARTEEDNFIFSLVDQSMQ